MLPFKRIYSPTVKQGSLINFQYLFYKTDQNPLVLVTSMYSDGRIAGVNLHYLTYRYVSNLLKNFCGKNVNYQQIKGDVFLYRSFRTYKKYGIKNLHMLDCDALNQTLSKVRSFNFKPNELKTIQDSIRQQIKDIRNPTINNPNAQEMAGKLQSMLTPQQHSMFTIDKRTNPSIQGQDLGDDTGI